MKTTRRGWGRTLVWAILVASLPGAVRAQDPVPAQERVEEVLRSFLSESGVPGVSVAWGQPGDPVRTATAGVADRASGREVTDRDRFHAGSVGKTFVAAAVLSLVQDGTLKLDAPLGRWLASEPWLSRLPNGKELTLRHLLSHTAGLPDHVSDPGFETAVASALSGSDPDPDFTFSPEDLVSFVLDDEPLFQAGSDYAYSDTNYILLGLVIEEVVGRGYYDVLRDRFLDPLGLRGTVPADRRAIEELVVGYNPQGWLGLPERIVQEGKLVLHPANEWTGGGVASTPRDLVRWILALTRGETDLGRGGYELMRTGAPAGARGRYGLGLSLGRTRHGPSVGHDGIFPGFRAKVAYYEDHGLAVSAMANQNPADLGGLVDRIAAVLLNREGSPAGRAPEAVPAPGSGSGPAAPCASASHRGLTGTWRLGMTVPNGSRVEGVLELRESPEGDLEGTWTRPGLETQGRLVWRLEGRREDGRFQVASSGPPTGPAASEITDVDGVGFAGEEADAGLRGAFFLVVRGERRDVGVEWSAELTGCGG